MKHAVLLAIFTIIVLAVAIFIPRNYAHGSELEYRLNIGVLTEHLIHDKSSYNEDSHLYQLTAVSDGKFLTAGTFKNTYKARSKFFGLGMEFESKYIDKLTFGYYLAGIHGYKGHRSTHYKGLNPSLSISISLSFLSRTSLTSSAGAVPCGPCFSIIPSDKSNSFTTSSSMFSSSSLFQQLMSYPLSRKLIIRI